MPLHNSPLINVLSMQQDAFDNFRGDLAMPEQQPKRSGREDDVEIKAPFGWSIRANGKSVSALIITILASGGLAYMIRDHDLKQTAQIVEASKDRKEQLTKITEQQTQLQESMDSVVYVLSLPQDERTRLKLDMPNGMRKKLLNQERNR